MYDNCVLFLRDMGFLDSDDLDHQVRVGREAISKANEQYEKGEPVLTDDNWHDLLTYINSLEKKLNVEVTSDCSDIPQKSGTLKPMHSLNKVYNHDNVVDFLMKFPEADSVNIEPKLDGVSMVICYRNYIFSHIQLKNKIFYREDAMKLPIKNMLVYLNAETELDSVDVRGEVVIPLHMFDQYDDKFNNARTMVSSMLNTVNVETFKYPHDLFDFIVFETMPAVEPPTGFEVVNMVEMSVAEAIDVVSNNRIRDIFTTATNYLLDGLVFKLTQHEHLGYTKKFPRNHIALKYITPAVAAKVLDIHIEDTPKGIRKSVRLSIEPTATDGKIIRSINLGSVDTLNSFDLKVGDYISFRLSGGIVPVIVEKIATTENNNGTEHIASD